MNEDVLDNTAGANGVSAQAASDLGKVLVGLKPLQF
jgi:hypothetical protein